MTERQRWAGIFALVLLLIYSKSEGGVLPTPDVVPGARTVVIIHESADKTPELGSLIINLRKRGGTAQAYLAGKGHSLYILDDDLQNKWALAPQQVPALFILDSTGKVLFEQAIPAGYTADNVIERLREHGG